MLASQQWYQKLWLLTLATLLIIHFARPHDLISVLAAAKPFSLVMALTFAFIVFSGVKITRLFMTDHLQMIIFWMILGWFIVLTPFAFSTRSAVSAMVQVLQFIPFMLSMILIIYTPQRMKIMVNVLVGCGVFVALQALLMHEGGRNYVYETMGAFLGDPNDLALFCNMILPFAYILFLNQMSWNWKKLFYLITCVLLIAVVVRTHSRGGFLGLIAVLGILWWFGPYKKRLLMMAIGGMFILGAAAGPAWMETISSTTNIENSTAQTRLTAWKATWDLFTHNPWGVGMNNVPSQMYKHIEYSSDRPENYYHGDVSHSLWFTWLAEGGIIGTILFVLLIAVNYSHALKLKSIVPIDFDSRFMKLLGIAFLASLTAFVISGTFLTVNYYPHIWYLTAFIVAGYNIARVRNTFFQ